MITESPLDEQLLNRTKVNWETLVELISLEDGLVDKLYARNCITNFQSQSIEAAVDHMKMASILLHIMTRKSMANFNRFVECLSWTQGRVAAILLNEDAGKLQRGYFSSKVILANFVRAGTEAKLCDMQR